MANVLKMMRQRREEEIRDFSAQVRALIRLFSPLLLFSRRQSTPAENLRLN
jgi:hypothetical protein